MKCPFCLKADQRILGAILLSAPKEWEKGECTAGERACSTCMLLIAQLLDTWREGGINSFVDRARSAGILKEKVEYAETGTRPIG
jgi:hypothetical protein